MSDDLRDTALSDDELHSHLAKTWQTPKGFRGALSTVDHKIIGRRYIVTAFIFLLLGGILSLAMRLQLSRPEARFIGPDRYNQIFTMHGTNMMFLFAVPVMEAMAVYLVPLMVGTRNIAFPRLNAFSYWMFLAGGILLWIAFALDVGPDVGWFAYVPLSGPQYGIGKRADIWAQMITFTEVSALAVSVELVVTVFKQRAPGMSLDRMPLFVWSMLVTAFAVILAMPAIMVASTSLILDRLIGTHFFNPAEGGDVLLWQHLFWFFGHPEVYIAILPGMGVASQILSTFSRKPIFGYRAMVYAMLSIGFFGFMVWGHHMFMSGMSPYSAFAFSLLTMCIGVPSAIKTFNWLGTMWGGRLRFQTPMLYAIGFVSLFVSGGLSGPFLAQPVLDIQLHDTYFVVGHFHLIMGVAAIFGMFAATYYWFPKMFGRMMNERWGKIHFFLTLAGTYAIFMPMHYLGMAGGTRRYSQYTEVAYLQKLMPLHQFMTYAAIITIAAQFIFVINLFWSMFWGPKASDNPWESTTLEWITATPPPHDNFGGLTPVVNHGPYEYGVPGAAKDFVMQTDPPGASGH
jgi:cytochrome c oxidase subunit I